MVQAACSELGAGPIGASVGNELVGRRCRVVHGEDPHAPSGVRIIRFRTSRNVTRRGRPHQPGGRLAQRASRVWRAGAGGDRVIQLGEPGDQEGQSSTAMIHDATGVPKSSSAWRSGALERDLARRSCLATNSGPVRAATRLMRWTRRESKWCHDRPAVAHSSMRYGRGPLFGGEHRRHPR
jgi:hypothetical protein